ncbi:MAG: SdiA-regulated domain-containing protein [Saprospiraceae bacterium]|nr:SdiA-regulated domain-containing protein [Saprospiraceae bacterium]
MPQLVLLGLFSSWFSLFNWLKHPFRPAHPPFPYHLNEPDIVFEMPEEIKEISGLSIATDSTGAPNLLAAINDEVGVIFLLDKKTGTVKSKVPFKDSGDFEGVEIVGNDAWAIKSSGTLYQIKDYQKPNPQVEKYKAFLNSENDVEGLAYDAANNRLLLGCKGKGVDSVGTPLNKAIYPFDLATKTFGTTPAYLLTLPDLTDFIQNSGEFDAADKMERIITAERTEIKFSPSGIAIHPMTGEIYVTSARGNTLLVLDAAGKIKHVERLKKSTHAQPEGICFDAEGNLFIANEGVDGTPGKVYGFIAK